MSDLITLTDRGLYCEAGDFFVDAWKPVHRSFVTHGHGDHAHIGMGEYWCSAASKDILNWRLGVQNIHTLDYGEQRRFGDVLVSLHPAGHILGSAQIRVEREGEVWVFTGDFKREPDPTCAPFEVVPCDVFICEATFAFPVYSWPAIEQEISRVLQWRELCESEGKAAILYAYSLGKAQRILAELNGKLDRPVLLHGAMERGVDVYRRANIALAPTELVMSLPGDTSFAGRLVLAPPSAQDSAWTRRFRSFEQAQASGWMQLRGNRRRRNLQRGFVISDHADWNALIETIRESGAHRVIATHGNTDALIPYLERELGVQAERLRTAYGDDEELTANAENVA
ncbi:ligase-associated DNA damage response exonuclease [Diaphorobacter aerolatus]|uniref:Ligase-associated DNA damage response exonuclease n=1 Tax=Diaphorobacter aerolatus TaxID=1288495 RepID=A0A7H0GN06_9BURK|nr:ligase-associated DNA damage response exonuclease [Diaphorobacter aerolatus]QNP49672.1 ligase-associated DNA damage response exonuclease [Diaphorobacter aerolatus]